VFNLVGVAVLLWGAVFAPNIENVALAKGEVQMETAQMQKTVMNELEVLMDGKKEKIKIVVPLKPDDIPAFWSFRWNGQDKIKVMNGADGQEVIIHYKLEVMDIDHDHTEEILFYRYSTGTAGATFLDVYKPSRGEWNQIFSTDQIPMNSDNHHFEMTYSGNYQVKFVDKQLNKKAMIPLDPANYKGMEHLLEGITTWIDPVMKYEILDLDGDGVSEIVTSQNVIGVSHPDIIAQLKTTFKLKGGTYKPAYYTLVKELVVVEL
jgi:hypothetical protein